MFSVKAMTDTMRFGTFQAAASSVAPITVAAPVMSCFISSMRIEGLIEIPPLSKVTPLPTRATVLGASASPPLWGLYRARRSCLRAQRPGRRPETAPFSRVAQSVSVKTVHLRPYSRARRLRLGGEILGRAEIGRLIGPVARHTDGLGDRAHALELGFDLILHGPCRQTTKTSREGPW